jgi:hypothetical protein
MSDKLKPRCAEEAMLEFTGIGQKETELAKLKGKFKNFCYEKRTTIKGRKLHVCPVCGSKFFPADLEQHFCSDQCRYQEAEAIIARMAKLKAGPMSVLEWNNLIDRAKKVAGGTV